MKKNSVIIYSGGLDSTVLLYTRKPYIKLAITFDYGSKHNEIEYRYAQKNTSKLDIPHIRIKLPLKYMKSNLLKKQGGIPEGHYEDISMKKTVVPFRNGIMLSIAAGIAESIGCSKVLIANHAGDHTIYPDCRAPFINAMSNAISHGTYGNLVIDAPFTDMTKRDIALLGKSIGVDFTLTYSCYNGRKHHCGKCGTCVERKEALQGFDKTIYEDSRNQFSNHNIKGGMKCR
jgi:7-cyano-7-deazaguanine synthase